MNATQGGIESSVSVCIDSPASCVDISTDGSINELTEDNDDEPLAPTDYPVTSEASANLGRSDRREKISTFLNQQRARNMGSKKSLESQQLHFLKEDLQLKRKLFEQGETLHNEFISEAKKMTTSMDKMATAMTSCFQMMENIPHTLHQQQ